MFHKPPHDQQIFFDNGTTRWIRDVIKIEQGNWYHFLTEKGEEYITNPSRILFVRVYPHEKVNTKPIKGLLHPNRRAHSR